MHGMVARETVDFGKIRGVEDDDMVALIYLIT